VLFVYFLLYTTRVLGVYRWDVDIVLKICKKSKIDIVLMLRTYFVGPFHDKEA
jgi:hypothetical protein